MSGLHKRGLSKMSVSCKWSVVCECTCTLNEKYINEKCQWFIKDAYEKVVWEIHVYKRGVWRYGRYIYTRPASCYDGVLIS